MNRMRSEIAAAALGPVELNGDEARQDFRFTPEFIGFAGHFPGYPILPAVLQVLLAQRLAEQLAGEKLQFLSLERAKFTQQLRPGDLIGVKVCRKQTPDLPTFNCELQRDGSKASSFSLTLGGGVVR